MTDPADPPPPGHDPLVLVGPVVTSGAGLPTWNDGPAVLWDHGPQGSQPSRITVPCPCGGTLTTAVPDPGATDLLQRLHAADRRALGIRVEQVTTGRALRGHLGLDVAATVAVHDGHRVLVVVAMGEHQPMRELGVLQGVAEVEGAPA